MFHPTDLTIRAATAADDEALRRLAALDRRPHLRGPALLAERDGVPIAAIGLTSGSVAADPGKAGLEAVVLLRRGRGRALRQGGDVAPAWSLLRRLAPRPECRS